MTEFSLASYANKPLAECTELELFNALLSLTKDAAAEKGYNQGKKRLYYISAEFLIGKLLSNNLINLGLYDQVRAELAEAGRDLAKLEEFENEPSLGNGGLGRLAACFLDSCATLGLPASGVGLAYHCGLFRQSFDKNKQYESPDYWLRWGQESWMRRTPKHYTVNFGDLSVTSTMYQIDVTGYHSQCDTLNLFDVDTVDERVIKNRINFDKSQVAKNLTLFLYPDDSDEAGRILRVYQEYFMVSNAAQLMLDECVERGSNLHDLADYAAVQINDTHPTMVIPELIRLLGERGIGFDEAVQIVRDTCAYTNHTILAEALECWPLGFIERVAPQLVPIIQQLDAFVRGQYEDDFVQVIDKWQNVHMANIDIHFSHSVNGVAALHTKILEDSELAPFYKIYPEKFNNKTNGITFRRWMVECNPGLNKLVSGKIGEGWKTDAEQLEQLLPLADDPAFLAQLDQVKRDNKQTFATWLAAHQGTVVDPDSVFDVQSKRLHEYKRQQLNLLYILTLYRRVLQDPDYDMVPHLFIFGSKAAPAYVMAKEIIYAINKVGEKINNDQRIRGKIKVVFIPNYRVSLAEKIIPAADVSEQISTAGYEASGTSNMKLAMNGAITLGTLDGANIEIVHEAGEENNAIFGLTVDEVKNLKASGYNPWDYYNSNPEIKAALDWLDTDYFTPGRPGELSSVKHALLEGGDTYLTLADFASYAEAQSRIDRMYRDKKKWAHAAIVNSASMGKFNSDRSIEDYSRLVWNLNECDVK